ncbi:MAG: preprotein translocase subunit SecA [Romboutsia sp.]|uniref:preprotein translocase subunit SecA n=1 Tax=Romboutsia sp. TaxID=1965302 RepID=UPI003F3BF2FF
MSFLNGIFNIEDKKELKRLNKIVDKIDSLESKFESMEDEEIQNMTNIFRERLSKGEILDDILPEVFAVLREASKRVLGMKHYRVQLIGGIVLHEGRIAEMRTGEGKTLVGTAPVYLNALTGKGVHVVTVNDYLAKRDKEEMAKLYEFLGLSVGVIINGQTPQQRKMQYKCDITYGTNNEYGFDYLKDNMAMNKEEKVQRELNYAIIDEVDSILIDEARTPLIISGPGEKSTHLYSDANIFILTLNEGDYEVDEKQKSVSLTENGIRKSEVYFNVETIADIDHTELYHNINQALRAHKIMIKNIDYVCKNGEVVIVDEFTGRIMEGRRYSNGLHQAIEAKEGLRVQRESKTLATVTFQNYFRMYNKISGMTGTGKTEEEEFKGIYKMDIVQIPTNKPILRQDLPDIVYKTEKEKFDAVVEDIIERNDNRQPVLVGTVSIKDSENISELLKKKGVKHRVLNAKYHNKEAEIIAQAGRLGAVTIATNMAGRGTDISLGGNALFITRQKMKELGYEDDLVVRLSAPMSFFIHDEQLYRSKIEYESLYQKYKYEIKMEQKAVFEAGGLAVIGTERHESRRIDNQLRGRAGRQGDPGCSTFYISLEDELMRLFGSDRMKSMVEKLGIEENTPIVNKMLTKSIESAQKKVEGMNYGVRKNVLQYDDVMNKQRAIIYEERNKVLNGDSVQNQIINIIQHLIEEYAELNTKEDVIKYIKDIFNVGDELNIDSKKELKEKELSNYIYEVILEIYKNKEQKMGNGPIRHLERMILLRAVDKYWIDHIDAMDQLRQGISLRSIGQQDPAMAYKNEGFDMFNEMNKNIQEYTIKALFNIDINTF